MAINEKKKKKTRSMLRRKIRRRLSGGGGDTPKLDPRIRQGLCAGVLLWRKTQKGSTEKAKRGTAKEHTRGPKLPASKKKEKREKGAARKVKLKDILGGRETNGRARKK